MHSIRVIFILAILSFAGASRAEDVRQEIKDLAQLSQSIQNTKSSINPFTHQENISILEGTTKEILRKYLFNFSSVGLNSILVTTDEDLVNFENRLQSIQEQFKNNRASLNDCFRGLKAIRENRAFLTPAEYAVILQIGLPSIYRVYKLNKTPDYIDIREVPVLWGLRTDDVVQTEKMSVNFSMRIGVLTELIKAYSNVE